MAIEPVTIAAAPPYASQFPEKQPHYPDASAAAPAASYQQDTVSFTQGTEREAMGKISQHIDGRNAQAKALQLSFAKLQEASKSLVPLKTQLFKIVKNYPPFGIDSESRREILRSYSAIRKEIDSMTIPAPPKQFYDAHASFLAPYFDGQGKLALQDLPVLPLDAPDRQVHDAAAVIDAKIAKFQASSQVMSDLLKGK